jgi:hypothetical protein
MNINITYPELSKKKATRAKLIRILRLPFIISAIACPIINMAVGGLAWSVIALFGLNIVWNMFVAIDLIEYNRTSQFIKFITYSIIMLILIDVLITPGINWGSFVIPIVTFSALVVAAVLFFTDFERQRHNLMPLLIIDIICIFAAVIMICVIYYEEVNMVLWPYITMGGVSLALLVSLMLSMKGGFFGELKRRFHAKID